MSYRTGGFPGEQGWMGRPWHFGNIQLWFDGLKAKPGPRDKRLPETRRGNRREAGVWRL